MDGTEPWAKRGITQEMLDCIDRALYWNSCGTVIPPDDEWVQQLVREGYLPKELKQ